MAHFPRFYARLAAVTYGIVLAATLFTVLLTRFIGGEAIAQAWAGVEQNADWQPVIGLAPQGIEFVLVPAGCFMMGSTEEQVEAALQQCEAVWGAGSCQREWFADEQPVHRQCFDDPFWIGRYEVTNAQYQECVDAEACEASRDGDNSDYNDPGQPVVGVMWFQARDYAEWAGCRLPTEPQWEYAARGPDGLAYPWGDEFDGSRLNYCEANCERGWRDENADDGYALTAPVGSYSPAGDSWVGEADMSGNVWEWTSTIFQDYPYDGDDERENLDDAGASRVVRGGSWYNNEWFARAAFRDYFSPVYWNSYFGFRVVSLRPPS